MLDDDEISYIEALLADIDGPISVLEWGSGGSTAYFPARLRERGVAYRWVSLEYDESWYAQVQKWTAADPATEVVLFPTDPTQAKRKDVTMDEYVNYPSILGETSDLIFVDGRKRRRCLLTARNLLTERGVVLLHDAQRSYYHCAWRAYPSGRIVLGKLWLARIQPPSFKHSIVEVLTTVLFEANGRFGKFFKSLVCAREYPSL